MRNCGGGGPAGSYWLGLFSCWTAPLKGPGRTSPAFVKEAFLAKETFGSGSVWDIGFSTDPAQTYAIVIDGTNQQVYVLRRASLELVSTFGGAGHWAGQFYGAHNLAVDSKGNLFITETYEGKRVQKFVNKGLGPVTKDNQGVVCPTRTTS